MSSFLYYLGAAGDSVLSVFGVRAPYEQPKYHVAGHLADGVEIRAYGPRVVAETPIRGGNDGEAFGRLFRYITGANQGDAKIAMTVPVEMAPRAIPMTIPVEVNSDQVMRFFLPKSIVKAGPPAPTDPLVHIVNLPAQELAVLRFSGCDYRGLAGGASETIAGRRDRCRQARAWRADRAFIRSALRAAICPPQRSRRRAGPRRDAAVLR